MSLKMGVNLNKLNISLDLGKDEPDVIDVKLSQTFSEKI